MEPTKFDTRTTDDELVAAARAIYETTAECTPQEVARQMSLPPAKVRGWMADARAAGTPWRMLHHWEAEQKATGKAGLARDLADTGAEADAAARELVENLPVTIEPGPHKELLTRHQQEWVGPRALAYQAIKLGREKGRIDEAFTLAKLAKISAETLTLVQLGERKAHGVQDGEDGAMVVIERGRK